MHFFLFLKFSQFPLQSALTKQLLNVNAGMTRQGLNDHSGGGPRHEQIPNQDADPTAPEGCQVPLKELDLGTVLQLVTEAAKTPVDQGNANGPKSICLESISGEIRQTRRVRG